jgi:hypothetical protein
MRVLRKEEEEGDVGLMQASKPGSGYVLPAPRLASGKSEKGSLCITAAMAAGSREVASCGLAREHPRHQRAQSRDPHRQATGKPAFPTSI